MFWEETVIHVYGNLGDDITLNCTLAALPYEDVAFQWTHTGVNGTRSLDSDHQSIDAKEIVSSTVTLYDLDKSSHGNVTCTVTNEVGTGEGLTFYIHLSGEMRVTRNPS